MNMRDYHTLHLEQIEQVVIGNNIDVNNMGDYQTLHLDTN